MSAEFGYIREGSVQLLTNVGLANGIAHFDSVVVDAQASPSIYPAGQLAAQYDAQRGDHPNVIATIQPMMKKFPDDASLNDMLASAYRETGDLERSSEAMDRFFGTNKNLDRLRASRFDFPLPQQ